MVSFPVKVLAPGRAVENKVAPKATVHIGVQIALGTRTQVTGLLRLIVQFHSQQIQHRVGNGSIIVCARSGSSGCRSRWSFDSQRKARHRLGAASVQQQVGTVSGVHTLTTDGSVSDVSLSALRHSERQAASVRHSCFEHRIDQASENDFGVLMLSKQHREDVDGSIDQFSSQRLESPLALKVEHRDEATEVDGHVQQGDDGWPNEGDFGGTAVAMRC